MTLRMIDRSVRTLLIAKELTCNKVEVVGTQALSNAAKGEEGAIHRLLRLLPGIVVRSSLWRIDSSGTGRRGT
jgi:hypothetical protein